MALIDAHGLLPMLRVMSRERTRYGVVFMRR